MPWSEIDTSVTYAGPRATIATITGSPLWGLGDRFPELAEQRGFKLVGTHRLPTPYGVGPQLEHYTTPDGRPVLRIPSYGMVRAEDWILRKAEWKVFWLLWQAGVRVLMVGGTSGTCDWREGEDAVRPGDMVLPWSFISFDAMPSGLPGTTLESTLAEHVPLMSEPFCPSLARVWAGEVSSLQHSPFRRIHDQDARVLLNRWHYGAFESVGQAMLLRHFGQSVGCPVITGDCVSPPLARVCGMHMLYYHVPSNWAEGLRPQNLTSTLDQLYVERLPGVIGELELRVLARLDEPTDCRCRELLRPRPPAYSLALSASAIDSESG
jgi:purine nucleoside phosphorylase